MNKVLKDEEIQEILNIRRNKKYKNMGEVLEAVKLIIPDFDYSSNSIKNRTIMSCISACGNIENNNFYDFCPFCKGKYVLEYLYGDVFFRVLNGNEEQKAKEREKLDKMGLFINISPYAKEGNQKDYCCLNCGEEW